MFGRKKKGNPVERLPWYRARGYKGNLTEHEKRQLDSFRMQEHHPAATFENLPEEVQGYINKLEMEHYDEKQGALVLPALVVMGFGGYFLIRYIFGYDEGSLLGYGSSIALLVLPWIYYARAWRKNADEFMPKDGFGKRDEAFRTEWELEYISNNRYTKKTLDDSLDD
jgi:hypothetical protein